ncbi:FemAB family PEP-CTERM system-associated protein [Paraglaciecola aquimarina]|uniref:FemAB family PEP-CTERM system-associated protein n=1 Tax=Paraglaciecola aquimarina TaxID=1235557 RepID=A0ABU3T269_9ALTE|nr:FemAB family XrtA/PEP-CTERM system-associated protein [Paraglaciecola aquimarina]MDU0356351.1 FemAB family PEP-CTERM system-associated protein [Paraglaciecola aquimarina]
MSVVIKKLSPALYKEWDEYVATCDDASIYHQSRWISVISASLKQDCIFLYAEDSSGNICGVFPLVELSSLAFGRFMVSMPYFNYGGILADSDVVRDQLLEEAKRLGQEHKIDYLQIRESSDALVEQFVTKTDKVNMILALPESAEALGKSIGSKRRSQIKRPQRENVRAEFGGVELLDDFYHVFCINMRDLGTPVYSRAFFLSILQTFVKEAQLCVVYWDDKPVSTGFLIRHKDQMEIPWASTVRYANRISINMYLYWEILSWSIAQGCSHFDFGRSTVDAGTYKFKKQWGAQPQQCYWYNWVPEGKELPNLSPSNSKFDMAIKIWQKLPLWFTKLIGPILVRSLP